MLRRLSLINPFSKDRQMPHVRNRKFSGGPIAVVLLTASCGQAPSKATAVAAAQARPAPAAASGYTIASSQDFRAAAEPFEVLTETAFGATQTALDGMVRKAQLSGQSVRALLPGASKAQLDVHLAALQAAHVKMDRAAIALSSIEIYRDLVSAAPNDPKFPRQVSLLDYAGFRYAADLRSRPARWRDMTQAVAFAKENWAQISSRVKDPALSARVAEEIAAMGQAALHKNEEAAAQSVKAELDLVDQLEQYFAHH